MVEAPLTWGQRDIWRAVIAAGPEDFYLNISRVFAGPRRPVPVDRAMAALDLLVARHEALHTRLTGPRDAPRQLIDERMRPVAQLVEAVADPQELGDRLAATAFDYWAEPPIRVAFVVADGHIKHVILVLCHLAADGHAADLVVKDFRQLLLRGALPPSTQPRPRDLAGQQHSAEGRRVSGEAVESWLGEYRRMDPVPELTAVARAPRFWEATMTSPALAEAAHAIGSRLGLSTSTVLLTAGLDQVGELTGQRVCGMRVIVNNRFSADRRDVVSTISQEGLVVLDRGQPSFDDLVRQAWGSAVRGYRKAQYDPFEMEEAVAPMGPRVRSFGCFNDLRLVQADALPQEHRVRETSVEWTDMMDHNICDFRLHIGGEPGRLAVSLYADTALLAPGDIKGFLRGMEARLVGAASA